MHFIAGPYAESHAHRDQGSFSIFSGTTLDRSTAAYQNFVSTQDAGWLTKTANAWSRSGIHLETNAHNIIRFVRTAGPNIGQSVEQRSHDDVYDTNGDLLPFHVRPATFNTRNNSTGEFNATVDVTPAYSGLDEINSWTRNFNWADKAGSPNTRVLTIDDTFSVDAGVESIFQVNVPFNPTVGAADGNGHRVVTAGRLRMVVRNPLNADIQVVNWAATTTGSEGYTKGYRIEVRGGIGKYIVDLEAN
jgi:hypothetical protein